MSDIHEFLQERKERELLRRLRPAELRKGGRIIFDGCEYFDFSSNDYLGLSDNPYMKDASVKAIEKYGTGASASRLLSGDLRLHHVLEEKTALFKRRESAIVFNSGYQANIGIIGSLCKKNDAVFLDKLSHASIIDGAALSGVKFFRFRHNDIDHLEALLKKERDKYKNCLIITETVFSMEGDRAPIKELIEIKEKFGCSIMADEAHATGIYGERGSGILEEDDISGSVDFVMGTFSKALGSFGAYLACSKEVKEYLVNVCRSFIYSTALPPGVIMANLASLELVAKEPHRRKHLLENTRYFRNELTNLGFDVRGNTQIVPVILKDSHRAVRYSDALREKNFWVLPIRTPTVPEKEARLRFSVTYNHDREILYNLVNTLKGLGGVLDS